MDETRHADQVTELREKIAQISAENCDLMAECHRLTAENHQHQELLHNASEAIVVLSPDGMVWNFNRAAEQVFGVSASELLGRSLSGLIPCPSHGGNVAAHLRDVCQRQAESPQPPIVARNAAGGRLFLRAAFGEVRSNTEIWGDDTSAAAVSECVLGMFRDVTEEVELERRLRDKTELLENTNHDLREANRSKDEFLANMSHELRTPLHGILSFARFGLKKWQDAPREKLEVYFQTIETSGRSLLTLVNDLLDLAKLQDGKMTFEMRPFPLTECVEQALTECQSLFKEKSITCRWECPDGDWEVLGDRSRLKQVVLNILSNAIRYSPHQGTIHIDGDTSTGLARLRFLDNGPGIPEAELETVFEKFVQSSHTKSGAGGTGLGLPICREILNSHSGRIRAIANPNGGCIEFDLPTRAHFERVLNGEVPLREESEPAAAS